MTLDEKIAQLIQLASHFYEGSNAKGDSTGPIAELGISEEHRSKQRFCHWCIRS